LNKEPTGPQAPLKQRLENPFLGSLGGGDSNREFRRSRELHHAGRKISKRDHKAWGAGKVGQREGALLTEWRKTRGKRRRNKDGDSSWGGDFQNRNDLKETISADTVRYVWRRDKVTEEHEERQKTPRSPNL